MVWNLADTTTRHKRQVERDVGKIIAYRMTVAEQTSALVD